MTPVVGKDKLTDLKFMHSKVTWNTLHITLISTIVTVNGA